MKMIRAVSGGAEWICLRVTEWTGSTPALVLAVFLIVAWACTGPFYSYSDTWQLIANTFTTLVAFVMVFVLQRANNKHDNLLHKKLDKIVAKLDANAKNAVRSDSNKEV